MNKSNLLMYLLKSAEAKRKFDGVEMLSANYLFAAALQALLDKEEGKLPYAINNADDISELVSIQALLDEYKLNYKNAIDDIYTAVTAKGYDAEFDGFRFGVMYYYGEAAAAYMEKPQIDAEVFVTLILEDQTAIIKKCLNPEAVQEEEEGLALDEVVASVRGRQMLLDELQD